MQTENNAPIDTTTTAPAGTVDTSQTTTPPASGQGDAGQGATDTGTSTTAEGQTDDQGKQQEGTDGTNTDPADRDDQGRYKSKVQKRIDELTHARHAAEREAARWRSIAEGQKASTAPQAHEYATDADYETALRRHEAKEAARETAAENAKHAAQQYQQDAEQAIDATYNERVQAAVTRFPDFVDVVGKADIKISADMLQALKESEHGPDIVYQLAKNPAEAERLAGLNVRQLDREIGRMEAAIAAKGVTAAPTAAAPAARTTSAPPPVKPGAPAAAPANTDPSSMNQEQYEAWRRGQGSRYIR